MKSYYPVVCANCGLLLRVPERILPPLRCSCGAEVTIPAGIELVTEEEVVRQSRNRLLEAQRAHWLAIHRFPFTATDEQWRGVEGWHSDWRKAIPNSGCSCLKHWKELEARFPPDFTTRERYFAWGHARHNDVNKRPEINKPLLSMAEALEANGILPDCPDRTQPAINSLRAVTSVSPLEQHCRVQPRCLDSWRRFGLQIVSVNPTHEIEKLRDLYPQVSQWVASDGTGAPRINELVAQANASPIMLVNSDIELRGDQNRLLDIVASGKVGIGLRYNWTGHWRSATREPWGIDAFLIRPEHVRSLLQLPLTIGRPMWDYWLPYHFKTEGMQWEWIGDPFFYHEAHAVHWSNADVASGINCVHEHYGIRTDWVKERESWPFPPSALHGS